MWILPLIGYLGVILGFCFLTLAIASGLYYLSELVEEHSVISKRLLYQMIYGIIGLQVLLWLVDRFPFWPTVLGVISHGVYALNLRRFPVVKLTDPTFLVSCVLVLVNHYIWFRHFSDHPSPSTTASIYDSRYDPSMIPSFTDVASYFGLCVWLVPFSLFVSLSAGENVLPTMGSEYATGEGSSFVSAGREPASSASASGGRRNSVGGGMRQGMAKAAISAVGEWVSETGELLGFWKGEKTRSF